MVFKVITCVLALLVAGEALFIVMNWRATNRFKPVDGYDGLVAFDTATGQLCKTLRTKSAAQIEREAQSATTAKEMDPCPPPPHTGDPIIDAIDSAAMSKRCGGVGDETKSESDFTTQFVAGLPICAKIR